MILNYIKENGIDDISHVKLTRLVPRNRDPSTISYLSFKIDTDAIIQKHDFWPKNSKFKQSVKKRPSTAKFLTQAPNF